MSVRLESASALGVADIRDHYDLLSPLYRRFWGEHIHHGFWRDRETAAEAQANLTHELAQRAGIARGEHVLDVGCGLGGSALLLAAKYGCRVEGISISPKQIVVAKRESARRGLQNRATFAVVDANALPVGEVRYDVVWTIECSEHLFDKAKFVSTAAALLNPGGRLAICAWLAGENLNASRRRLVEEVCHGMLCPSLGTMADYVGWTRTSGLELSSAEDITKNVSRTWDLCRPMLEFPFLKTFLAAGSPRLHAFARSFASIAEAYRSGAMAYGLIVARKPPIM
jgi:tocopherol O-methyltransferase